MQPWQQHLEESVGEVLLDAETLDSRIKELGEQITRDYTAANTQELVVIGILRGSVVFLSDLIRQLQLPDGVRLVGGAFGAVEYVPPYPRFRDGHVVLFADPEKPEALRQLLIENRHYTQSIYRRKGAAGNQRAVNKPPRPGLMSARVINP